MPHTLTLHVALQCRFLRFRKRKSPCPSAFRRILRRASGLWREKELWDLAVAMQELLLAFFRHQKPGGRILIHNMSFAPLEAHQQFQVGISVIRMGENEGCVECAMVLPLELGLAEEVDGGLHGKGTSRGMVLTKISSAHLASP